MKWSASAPANIALIKYMGKIDSAKNLPLNSSLSYTLEHCRTFVEVEINNKAIDQWEPLLLENNAVLALSEHSVSRFLNHVKLLKERFNCSDYFLIKSANNFPADCGLASSASSYAALTKAVTLAITEIMQFPSLTTAEMAYLSQLGSGSSCRSFYSPWCLWQENNVTSVDLPYQKLLHQVIVVDKEKKVISSSRAHQLVQSSALYIDRKHRSEQRLNLLLQALVNRQWQQCYILCWQEFWDMHALFETCKEPFGYMTALSIKVINLLRDLWQKIADGPLITMDAGPNIHLLYREDQLDLAVSIEKILQTDFTVIKNYEAIHL